MVLGYLMIIIFFQKLVNQFKNDTKLQKIFDITKFFGKKFDILVFFL